MSTAEAVRVDYKLVYQKLKEIYEDGEGSSQNVLADYIQSRPKDFDPKNYRVRNQATLVHASASRNNSGSSVLIDEQDWKRSAYKHAVSALPDPFPSHIRGRFKPNPDIAEKFLVTYPLLAPHEDKETITAAQQMMRKKDMLDHIYSPRMVPDEREKNATIMRKQAIWERYGYTSEQWMDCKERKTWDWVNRKLKEHLRPAIDAWVAECERRGLEI
tara:strand:- start:32247 stop:32894 length:648 start_codon:yes stop_codon:yes gene_type:complete